MLRFRTVSFVLVFALASVAAGYFAYGAFAQQPNRPPVAMPDSVTVHKVFAGGNALANDSDPDGDNLLVTYTSQTQTPLGSGNVGYNGHISFSAGPNSGTVTIPYTIFDSRGGNATSYVTFNVVNSAPTANWDLVVLPGLNNGYSDRLNVLANDSDADGDTFQSNYQPGTMYGGGAGQYSLYNGIVTVSRYP